jgi:hypothetical protein
MPTLKFPLADVIYTAFTTPTSDCPQGVLVRVYSTPQGSVLSLGRMQAFFADPTQLRGLAGALNSAADHIEEK